MNWSEGVEGVLNDRRKVASRRNGRSGTITGDDYGVEIYGGTGTVTNAGLIVASGICVELLDGGTVTNDQDARIAGGSVGVYIDNAVGIVGNA
jgi:hypothetical protein